MNMAETSPELDEVVEEEPWVQLTEVDPVSMSKVLTTSNGFEDDHHEAIEPPLKTGIDIQDIAVSSWIEEEDIHTAN